MQSDWCREAEADVVQTVPVRELGFSTETTHVEAQSRAVKLYADPEAIVVGYERLTSRELDERIDAVADGLGKLGLWKGRSGPPVTDVS